MLSNIAPFFIVEELGPSVAFYVRAGFDVRYSAPAQDPFFAIVGRDETRIFLKAITGDVLPLPNPIRHHWAPWDAFVSVEQPDTLAAESPMHSSLAVAAEKVRLLHAGWQSEDTEPRKGFHISWVADGVSIGGMRFNDQSGRSAELRQVMAPERRHVAMDNSTLERLVELWDEEWPPTLRGRFRL